MSSTPPVKDTYACDANGCQVIEETSILMEGAVTAGPLENDAGKPSREEEKQDQCEAVSHSVNPLLACVPGASTQGPLSTESVSRCAKQSKVKPESAVIAMNDEKVSDTNATYSLYAYAAFSVCFLFCLFISLPAGIIYTVKYKFFIAYVASLSCIRNILLPSVGTAVTLTCIIIKNNSCLRVSTHSNTCITFRVLGSVAFVCVAMFSPSTALGLTVTVVSTAASGNVLAKFGQALKRVVPLKKKCEAIFDIISSIRTTVIFVIYGVMPLSTLLFSIYPFSVLFILFIGICTMWLYVLIAIFILMAECYYFDTYKKNINEVRKLCEEKEVPDISFNFVYFLSFTAPVVAHLTPKFMITGYVINAAVSPVAIVASLFLISPASLQLLMSQEMEEVIDPIVADCCTEQSPSVQQIDESLSVVRKRVERGLERYSSERHAVGDGEKVLEQQIKPNEAPQYVNNIQGDGNKVVVIPPEYQGPLTVNIIAPK